MTYLELCQKLRAQAGISGVGPVTVVDQMGQLHKIVVWVNEAWQHIQLRRPNWLFLWGEFTFTSTPGVSDYAPADAGVTALASWARESVRVYRDDPRLERWLDYMDYPKWRSLYGRGVADNNAPSAFTITPNNSLRLAPAPDDDYTVSGEYYQTPTALTLDGDEPALPSQFHDLIVYEALKRLGMHEEAPAVVQRAQMLASPLWAELEQHQLPAIQFGGALA